MLDAWCLVLACRVSFPTKLDLSASVNKTESKKSKKYFVKVPFAGRKMNHIRIWYMIHTYISIYVLYIYDIWYEYDMTQRSWRLGRWIPPEDIRQFGECKGGPSGPAFFQDAMTRTGPWGDHDMPWGMDYLLYALCVHHDLRRSWRVLRSLNCNVLCHAMTRQGFHSLRALCRICSGPSQQMASHLSHLSHLSAMLRGWFRNGFGVLQNSTGFFSGSQNSQGSQNTEVPHRRWDGPAGPMARCGRVWSSGHVGTVDCGAAMPCESSKIRGKVSTFRCCSIWRRLLWIWILGVENRITNRWPTGHQPNSNQIGSCWLWDLCVVW